MKFTRPKHGKSHKKTKNSINLLDAIPPSQKNESSKLEKDKS